MPNLHRVGYTFGVTLLYTYTKLPAYLLIKNNETFLNALGRALGSLWTNMAWKWKKLLKNAEIWLSRIGPYGTLKTLVLLALLRLFKQRRLYLLQKQDDLTRPAFFEKRRLILLISFSGVVLVCVIWVAFNQYICITFFS